MFRVRRVRLRHNRAPAPVGSARTELASSLLIPVGGETTMFHWVILLFVVAICAAILGFGGIAASAAGAAKIVFIVALALAVIGFIADRARA